MNTLLRLTTIILISFFGSFSILAQDADMATEIDMVNIYFPKNAYKFKVSKEIKEYVKELNSYIAKNENAVVKLDGYAQDGSNDAWNTRVSKYRVRAVRDLLIDYGISNDRIEIEYFGKTKPISQDDSSRELAKNRRVELRILQEG